MLFPLFNFDFTESIPFDIRSTPSRMGALTETARTWPSSVRTGHPIYSFAALGAQAQKFSGVDNRSGYSANSPFGMLHDMDGHIAIIDLPDQHSMTFYHHVEEMHEVPYRYFKDFSGSYTDAAGQTSERTYSLFVRDVERGVVTSVTRMEERLWEKGLFFGQRPGVGHGTRTISARALFAEVSSVIKAGQAQDYLYEIEK